MTTAPNGAIPAAAGRRRAAGVAYVTPSREALFVRRGAAGDHKGEWCFPGGHLEEGEDAEGAARRESFEEVGHQLHPDVHELVPLDRQADDDVDYSTFTHRVNQRFVPKLNREESSDYAWAPLERPPAPLHPGVASLFKRLSADCELTGDDFNESDHPRKDDGKFGQGGGGAETKSGSSSPETKPSIAEKFKAKGAVIKQHGAEAREFVKGKTAGEVIGAVAGNHKTKEAMSFALQSLLSHVTGLDQSTWKLNEELVEHTIHDFSLIAGGTVLQAKQTMRKAIDGLIAARKKLGGKAMDADGDTDGVVEILELVRELFGDDEERQPDKPSADLAATDSACALALDRDTVREKDRDGRMRVALANISKAAVNPYKGHEIPDWETLGLDPNKVYWLLRDPKEMEKAAPSFNGVQILRKHIPVSADDTQAMDVVGATGTSAKYQHPYLQNSLHIWTQDAINDIESDAKKELSCGYHYVPKMTPGTYEGIHFDGIMTDIVGNHVALVGTGRAGPDVVVGDSYEMMEWHLLEAAILTLA